VRCLPLLLPTLLLLLVSLPAWASDYHGQVFCQGIPVPGASVAMTRGQQRVSTITDDQGFYDFPNLADGVWKIEIKMRGFATLREVVTVLAATPQGQWQLKMLDVTHLLAMAGGAPSQPQLAERSEENAGEQAGNSAGGFLINGTSNNAATSKYSLSPSFGNHRPGEKGLYSGGVGAVVDNSALDSRPYSLSGLALPKDSYNRITALATFGGPIQIPHLFYNGPNLFVACQWTRNADAAAEQGLVPSAAERDGDLSGLTNASGQPVTIYNPATGMPFTGPIPVSPQADALLALYPLPDLAGNSQYNYQTQVLNSTHIDALQSRLDKTIGHRDQLYGGFAFESSRAGNANLFGFLDTTDILGLDAHADWAHQFNHQIYAVFGYHFTRLRTEVRPQFDRVTNISGNAGIAGNDQDPPDWGPPALVFSSGMAGLTDGNSEFNRNRTDAVSFKGTWTHLRHTVSFGGDFRRQEFNEFAQLNPRGTFAFTGAATQAPAAAGTAAGTTGSDLADFLLGIPDTSAVQFGNPEKYFRASAYDAFIADEFRVMSTFTVNAGMRWEYGAPMSELFGRMVNLDIAPGFAAAAPVVAGNPVGPLTGVRYPASLVRPDYRGWEPRVGISWRPLPASTLVVRAGYGIYDDTSVYLSSAEQMAQQAPLSTSVSVQNGAACALTLADGFRDCAGTTADTYAVDPNLRVGYAQNWQLSAQTDLPGALVVTATYEGTKGTRGAQEFLPNTYPVGATNPYTGRPVGFVYRTSNGNSTREAGEMQLRRRLRSGLTATLDYTWAKALDDDSQAGAVGHVTTEAATAPPSDFANDQTPPAMIAQNWLDLPAERGLSTFDQRNLLTASFQYTTGMGLGGGTLLSGWRGRLFKEWTAMTQITAGSGLPNNPVVLAAVPGTGFNTIVRPDLTGASIYSAGSGRYLNAAAFTTPQSGQWGTARRNSITGPREFSLDSAMVRTFRIHSTWNLDVRAEATNLLNHPAWTAWNTTVNSPLFGLPFAVNPMRSVQMVTRLRF